MWPQRPPSYWRHSYRRYGPPPAAAGGDPSVPVLDGFAGVALIPAPVEVFGDGAELADQNVGQVLRLDLAAFFPPEPNKRGFISAHDDPGVGAADETAAI